jgi:hypothetical protein
MKSKVLSGQKYFKKSENKTCANTHKRLFSFQIKKPPPKGGQPKEKNMTKTADQKLEDIVTALNAYSDTQAPGVVKATLAGMDEASIGVLRGITGVFVHAVKSKMPSKWLAQIHGDLLDAFFCLSNIAHEERKAVQS